MKSETRNITIWVIATAIIVTLLGFGLLGEPSLYVRQLRMEYYPNFHCRADDYIIYIPVVIWLILLFVGVKGETSTSKWYTFLKGAFSFALMWIIVGTLKSAFGELRPDGSDYYSFPSGHTSSAFAASTLLYKEYGYKAKWTAILIFIPAFVVGAMRILNNRHWLNDVIAGALLGIVSVLLIFYWAELLYPRFKKKK